MLALMQYTIKINDDSKYIIYKHTGKIKRSEIGEAWRELLKMKEFTELGYNLISDYRESEFDFDIDEMPIVDEFLKSINHIISGKKNAVIIDNPRSTVFPMLYERKSGKELDFDVKMFSTEEAAASYVQQYS